MLNFSKQATPPRLSKRAPARTPEITTPSGGYGGGPQDVKVLYNYKNHIAAKIWEGDVSLLKGYCHIMFNIWRCASDCVVLFVQGGKCLKPMTLKGATSLWDYREECKAFRDKVKATGLTYVIENSYRLVNRALVSSLVERWYPETTTFHLPFGEATITLDDVANLTGLPIKGIGLWDGVAKKDMNDEDFRELLMKAFGMGEEEANVWWTANRAYTIKLTKLRSTFKRKARDDTPDDVLDRYVRAYILYIIGGVLLPDKSGNQVHLCYVASLLDLQNVKNISWGTALLAHTYRALSTSVMPSTSGIAMYFTLLEVSF